MVNPVDDVGQNNRERKAPAEDDQNPGYLLLVTASVHQDQPGKGVSNIKYFYDSVDEYHSILI